MNVNQKSFENKLVDIGYTARINQKDVLSGPILRKFKSVIDSVLVRRVAIIPYDCNPSQLIECPDDIIKTKLVPDCFDQAIQL